MLPVSMTPALAHTVDHAWIDSLDHTVKWTLTCACIQRLLAVLQKELTSCPSHKAYSYIL